MTLPTLINTVKTSMRLAQLAGGILPEEVPGRPHKFDPPTRLDEIPDEVRGIPRG
jgi:hypothetical protein